MESFRKRMIYRTIPGAPSAHASTICELRDGRLMAAWYAGSAEGERDVAVYVAWLHPGAEEWGPPMVLEKAPGLPEGNPVLDPEPDGGVTLHWVTMYEPGWERCRVRSRRSLSESGERRWAEARDFAPELGLMTRNKPLRMSNGEILLPLYDERDWSSFFAWSADDGVTWERTAAIRSEPGNIQPAAVEVAPGRLVALMRTGGSGGELWRSRSEDFGRSWSPAEPAGIANPNAATDLVRLASGRVALIFNDSSGRRTPLTVALSEDEGGSFPIRRNLETEDGEFSYPAIIQGRDGRIHATYTWRRETIAHCDFSEEWIAGR